MSTFLAIMSFIGTAFTTVIFLFVGFWCLFAALSAVKEGLGNKLHFGMFIVFLIFSGLGFSVAYAMIKSIGVVA